MDGLIDWMDGLDKARPYRQIERHLEQLIELYNDRTTEKYQVKLFNMTVSIGNS